MTVGIAVEIIKGEILLYQVIAPFMKHEVALLIPYESEGAISEGDGEVGVFLGVGLVAGDFNVGVWRHDAGSDGQGEF